MQDSQTAAYTNDHMNKIRAVYAMGELIGTPITTYVQSTAAFTDPIAVQQQSISSLREV